MIIGLLGVQQLHSQAGLEPNMLEELKSEAQIKRISANLRSWG